MTSTATVVIWAFAVLFVAGVFAVLNTSQVDREMKRREVYWQKYERK